MNKFFAIILICLSGCATRQIELDHLNKFIYKSVTIQIQPANGSHIDTPSLMKLRNQLVKYHFCKRENIHIIINDYKPTLTYVWTANLALAYIKSYSGHFKSKKNGHFKVFIALIPGIYVPDTRVIGVTFYKKYIALFNNCRSEVLLHELGHAIGLKFKKNNHCSNPRCVMYKFASKKIEFDHNCILKLIKMMNY